MPRSPSRRLPAGLRLEENAPLSAPAGEFDCDVTGDGGNVAAAVALIVNGAGLEAGEEPVFNDSDGERDGDCAAGSDYVIEFVNPVGPPLASPVAFFICGAAPDQGGEVAPPERDDAAFFGGRSTARAGGYFV